VVKELPKPNGKDEVTKKGVVNGSEQQRTGSLVSQ
jgi:hypothetical protein